MEFETIKEQLNNYMKDVDIKYLRKSNLADFAIRNNYEIEDVNSCINNACYAGAVTQFIERLTSKQYTRFVIGNLTKTDIETQTGLTYCNCCNVFTSSAIEIDGKKYCSIRCAQYDGYDYCSKCGKLEKIVYRDSNIHVCKECATSYSDELDIQRCNRCHKFVSKNDLYKVDTKHFCGHCVDGLNLINGYHGTPRNWKAYKVNREKSEFFGYENEFEIKNHNTPRNVIALGFKELLKENSIEDFFFFENDSSLSHGFEAITQPFTLAWLYENESKLQPVYDFLLNSNCSAEKTITTGLHIHFSRCALKHDYSLAKIAYLINKLQYDFIKYSGRNLNNLSYTCFDRPLNNEGTAILSEYKEAYRDNNGYNGNHSAIVNRQHDKTIEIRIFKGTLDLHRIIANVELVNNLVCYAETHTDAQVENVTFKELCLFKKTRYLKEYYYKIFEPKTKLKSKVVA